MTLYELFVFLHIVFAMAWVGGSTYAAIIGRRVFEIGDVQSRTFMTGFWEWISTRYFMPVSMATLIFGIAAVIEGPWSFSDPFVSIGLGVFILLAINGMAFFDPQSKKIKAETEEFGADSPQVTQRVAKLLTVSKIELAVLYALVFVMSVKPF